MREVRVRSLREVGSFEEGIRLSVVLEHDEVSLVFPTEIWQEAVDASGKTDAPLDVLTSGEIAILETIENRLLALARDTGFGTVLRDAPSGDVVYDLVLRSSDLYSVTTAYIFIPEVLEETVSAIRRALAADSSVEQVCIVGGTVTAGAFALADDDVRILAVRGRKSSVSRFEMAPELWKVLSGELRWQNVETHVPGEAHEDIQSNPSKG